MENKTPIPSSKSPSKSFRKNIPEKEHGFTLVELIIVIIIVGVLAALGMTQYTLIVEKARTAEAKVRIGAMRDLAYQYYIEHGSLTGIQYADVGVDNTCTSTDYYSYWSYDAGSWLSLVATRCTSGGKSPDVDVSRQYYIAMKWYPSTGLVRWVCVYILGGRSCFGLPTS
ncbi:MAG: prepilin-type N-terminal cleavage/methylation domain-containing protein [Candidatus Omnitrophica bacterium]|nr:prepilin-type N-terminal cleavage/methylation domain-containing protein [Candidatus Omnitrophota bacterium]